MEPGHRTGTYQRTGGGQSACRFLPKAFPWGKMAAAGGRMRGPQEPTIRKGGFNICPFLPRQGSSRDCFFPGGPGRLRGPRGDPPPFSFACGKRKRPRPVKRKPPGGKTPRSGLICRSTGVGRIGPADVGGPVDPAPSPGARRAQSPHNDCGGWTGWLSDLICFSFRALRAAPAVAVGFLIGGVGADSISARCPPKKPSPGGRWPPQAAG